LLGCLNGKISPRAKTYRNGACGQNYLVWYKDAVGGYYFPAVLGVLAQLSHSNAVNISNDEVKKNHAFWAIHLGEIDLFISRPEGIKQHIVSLEVYS
jgi:hypothetical protein